MNQSVTYVGIELLGQLKGTTNIYINSDLLMEINEKQIVLVNKTRKEEKRKELNICNAVQCNGTLPATKDSSQGSEQLQF